MNIDACVTLSNERETVLAPDELVRLLDATGVDRAVVQPGDRMLAIDNHEGNLAMAAAASAHPDRLIAACTVNPWYGERGVQELQRAVGQGARLLVFAPAVQGFMLGDELMWPLLDVAEAMHLPIYVHTGPHSHASPWQLVTVAERYPGLSFIMGHSGATDYWMDVPQAGLACDNIYLESSFARPFIMLNHLKAVGVHRGIMGSGAPRNELQFEWDQMRAVFPPADNAGLYGETLKHLVDGVRP